MKLLSIFSPRRVGARSTPSGASDSIRPDVPTVVAEPDFLRLVDLERKRTERTGRPVLLMLAQVERSADLSGMIRHIAEALNASKRQTDILGWYTHPQTLGVIFTEINHSNDLDDVIVPFIRARVLKSLETRVGEERLESVELSFHIFPERAGDAGQIDLTFYPAAMQKRRSRGAIVKRCADVILGALGLILFSPLFLTIAVAIKLTSKGAVLYTQERVGQFGRLFKLLKFRSMYVNSSRTIHECYVTSFISGNVSSDDNAYKHVFKIVEDPRVTPLGRFIRKWSMDEMPQFVNVLKGDMSLVGPRPPLPYEVHKYGSWHRRRIIEAKPGLTGLWQVNGRSKLTFDDMVRLDLTYIKHASMWLDLKILLKTPIAVMSGDGAY